MGGEGARAEIRVMSKPAVDCKTYGPEKTRNADVAKLVDARDLKSLDFGLAGSIAAVRTSVFCSIFPFARLNSRRGPNFTVMGSVLLHRTV